MGYSDRILSHLTLRTTTLQEMVASQSEPGQETGKFVFMEQLYEEQELHATVMDSKFLRGLEEVASYCSCQRLGCVATTV